jgi:hypothetical protein
MNPKSVVIPMVSKLFGLCSIAFVLPTAMFVSSVALAEVVSRASDLSSNKRTATYITSRPMMEQLGRFGVQQDRQFGLHPDCKSPYNVVLDNIVILSPIDFPDDMQHPVKGIWRFRYQFERCGDRKVYNLIYMANDKGETPAVKPYFPGTTYAGVILVKDAMNSALQGASVRVDKACKNFEIFDMRVSESPHDVVEGATTHKGVWNEIWTFRACGEMVEVPMTFIPDAVGGGTTFSSTTPGSQIKR